MNAEQERMATVGHPEHGLEYAGPWYTWGPYVSERAWGTVREDYSADGDAWRSFTHDQSRSRAYRWSEDGLAAICTLHQDLCLGLALWNGRDPILKERLFGLTGHEGNHGEDAKEYWWYVDATPSHSWLRWRYHYPQQAFPYDDLVEENGRRTRLDPEYELLDTGAFDGDRYWVVEVTYAKRGPTDILMTVAVTNAGPEADTLHVLPTLWFRDTWSWGRQHPKPVLRTEAGDLLAEHERAGVYRLSAAPGPGGAAPSAVFCDNVTNTALALRHRSALRLPQGRDQRPRGLGQPSVNPDQVGTKASWWYRLDIPPGETVELRLRLFSPTAGDEPDPQWAARSFETIVSERRQEADTFYAELAPAGHHPRTRRGHAKRVRRDGLGQAVLPLRRTRLAGRGPRRAAPAPGRGDIRNGHWRHLDAYDILSMPDPWEYPWFAAWDLAFHCVVLAHIDPAFAKYQLVLLCREWFMHPNGALPAYEWSFDDVNPPVHAWAALKVFDIDAAASGRRDYAFLERVFQKLLLNFTWWVNREDPDGNNVFEGGFLGLDNIGPDRPLAPAPWNPARTERRHCVDGVLCPCDAQHRAGPVGARRRLRGHRDEVLRALRRHHRRRRRQRLVGPGRRLLLRPAGRTGRHPHALAGEVRRRADPRARRARRRRVDNDAADTAAQEVRRLPGPACDRTRAASTAAASSRRRPTPTG